VKIYSLGTNTRTIEEFMGILKQYAIETAADVRSFPQSRFPHFNGTELARLLREDGIEYCYFGKDLRGHRRGGYEAYVGTPPYHGGLARLEGMAKAKTTAFFCAERFPWLCHRRFIGASLKERGWEVSHIIEGGKVWHPKVRSTGTARGEG